MPTRVNTFFRGQQFSTMNGFCIVQHIDVSAQYKAAIKALKKEAKFLTCIGGSSLPNGMDTIRNNLLQSMELDKVIALNQGNYFTAMD